MTENDIQRAIVTYLKAVLPDAMVVAIPNAARRTKGGKASNAVPGLLPGVPDIVVALSLGRTLWLEVKTGAGVVSKVQRHIGIQLVGLNHHWAVVRSIDDVRLALETWKIETREVVI